MKRSFITIAVLALFVLSLVPAFAGCSGGMCTLDAPKKAAATTCPIKHAGKSTATKSTAKSSKKTVSAICPVMGTKIPDVTKAAGKSVYKGKTYYFCCAGCKPAFDKNPEKYVKTPAKKK